MAPIEQRHAAMDDMAAWAQSNSFAAIACGIPEARKPTTVHHINVATMGSHRAMSLDMPDAPDVDDCDEITDAEHLEDVRHDMRVVWNEALATLGGLNPRKLPVVEHGALVLKSFAEVLADCGETNHLYVLLAEVLRGAAPESLHLHLRTTWIDGNDQALAGLGWVA